MNSADEAQFDLLWTVSVGMGVAVTIIVVILLNLLLQSVRALDKRVDHVWSSAVGVFVHTLTAAPQLQSAERHLKSFEPGFRDSGASATTPLSRFPGGTE